jgi:hypothetical protein
LANLKLKIRSKQLCGIFPLGNVFLGEKVKQKIIENKLERFFFAIFRNSLEFANRWSLSLAVYHFWRSVSLASDLFITCKVKLLADKMSTDEMTLGEMTCCQA